ncbi:MAG: DUF2569 domain-containing protein [Desulfobacterales bacterium]|nr:MAG: DUF2569 domain-containing protein [Desulfobacterales bacterium]
MTVPPSATNCKKKYNKIGGWLILCAVGLLLYPVQTVVSLLTEIIPAFSQNNWFLLTSPDSVSYHPLWGPLLIMELVGNVCFLIFSIFVITFFFKRRKFVPQLAIVFLASNLLFVGFDYYLARNVLTETDPANWEAIANLVRTLVASIIWVLYFIFSKRVKKTFIL